MQPPLPAARKGLSTRLAVTALSVLVLAFYHGLWLPGLVLIKRDAVRFYLPLWQYVIERLSAGELPYWIPYEGLGRPFIGISGIGIFHPFTVLYLFLPIHEAYRLSTLSSCLLAALGAFILGRSLNYSRPGALIAGIAFSCSGYVVSLTESVLWLYSISLLPLFCAALEKALTGNRLWVIAPASIWATVFLNGDIQTGYYYSFIALLWTITRAPRPHLEAFARLVVITSLAVLLAGIQLAPAWAVFVGSDRAQTELFHAQSLYWSTHPLRLASVLASPIAENENLSLLGRLLYGPPRAGVWAESLYLGVPVVGLALLAARYRRDLRGMAWLGGLAVLLALGRYGGIYEIFNHTVPFWSAFRYPEKLMGVFSFALAMLAGAGVDMLWAGKGHHASWFGGAVLCEGAALWLNSDSVRLWMGRSLELPEALVRDVSAAAASAFFFSAVAAVGMGLIVWGARRRWLGERMFLLALVAIVTLDLSRANLSTYHIGPAEAVTFTPPFAEAIRGREGTLTAGRFRLFTFNENEVVCPERVRRWLGFQGCWSVERRQALDMDHQTQFHIETIRGYLAGFSPKFLALFEQGIGIEGAARYNVAYYIGRRYRFKSPSFAQAMVVQLDDYDLALATNPYPAKPRAYLSLQPERAAAPVEPVALLGRADFLSGDVDVIETDAALPGPAVNGTVIITQYAPEIVRLLVETRAPAVLILLDAYDAGWRATLDTGPALPIMRANALVRAVVVPTGSHVVTFRYEMPLLSIGAAGSLTGTLICLAFIGHAYRRTDRQQRVA